MKTNLILLVISLVSAGYLMSLFIRAIIIPAWREHQYQKQHKENVEKKELKEFKFENGQISIYAKTYQGALFHYKEMKRELKRK